MWLTIFVLGVSLLIPLVWSFFYLEPGSASYLIAQFNLILLILLIVSSAVLIYIEWEPF